MRAVDLIKGQPRVARPSRATPERQRCAGNPQRRVNKSRQIAARHERPASAMISTRPTQRRFDDRHRSGGAGALAQQNWIIGDELFP